MDDIRDDPIVTRLRVMLNQGRRWRVPARWARVLLAEYDRRSRPYFQLHREIRELTAENKRLRAALGRVVAVCDGADEQHDYVTAEVDTDVIRAALTDTDGTTRELREAVRALAAAPTPAEDVCPHCGEVESEAVWCCDERMEAAPTPTTNCRGHDCGRDDCTTCTVMRAYYERLDAAPTEEPRHEMQCPECGATIRARMADAPTEEVCSKCGTAGCLEDRRSGWW